MRTIIKTTASLLFGALFAATVLAVTPEETIRPIQNQWAEIKYKTPDKQQADEYAALAKQARKLAESHPGQAEPLIWEGIVLSSEAGMRSLSALSLAKDARARFEEAMKIDEKALSGSALTSLATLYAKVPGWPIGFGDRAKAEELFKKALASFPDDIDANFFYGDYLAERDRIPEARRYLDTALKAPARPGRELADSGRRQEIKVLLAKLDKEAK